MLFILYFSLPSEAFREHLLSFLEKCNTFDILQSVFCKLYCMETARLKLFGDTLMPVDSRKCPVLVLLDLSLAFDTADHYIL